MFFVIVFFFFNDTATTEIYTLSLHDALPISPVGFGRAMGDQDSQIGRRLDVDVVGADREFGDDPQPVRALHDALADRRSEEHTSELQSRLHLVCRLLLEKKKKKSIYTELLRQ